MSATGEYVQVPDCLCGHGWHEHDITARVKACSRLSCGCARYRTEAAP